MYYANGDFINNQSIIENFKNFKKNKKNKKKAEKAENKSVSKKRIKFEITYLQIDNPTPITVTEEFWIERVPDSIDMYKYFLHDINKIVKVIISFNINTGINFKSFVVKTNNEAEVTLAYRYYQNGVGYGKTKPINNMDSNVKRFNYFIFIPETTFNIITKCNITIIPNSDSNVIIINDLKTAIEDIIV
jgi:hypothetical protein